MDGENGEVRERRGRKERREEGEWRRKGGRWVHLHSGLSW